MFSKREKTTKNSYVGIYSVETSSFRGSCVSKKKSNNIIVPK